jgi:hypothetical protein
MRKADQRKLTLSKETIASLEAGKLIEVAGGDNSLDGRLCYTMYSCPNTR